MEDSVNTQQTVNSMDKGVTLIGKKNKRSPAVEQVKVICNRYPGARDVFLFHCPPHIRVICDPLQQHAHMALAWIPCGFTTDPKELPFHGTFGRGLLISISSVCPP
jgi:hypothetical protein